jgi:hypothetical protein
MLVHLKSFSTFQSIIESIRIERIDPVTYENETVTSLPYINYIKDNRQDFLKKLVRTAKDLNINPLWLMHTIFHESRFDSRKSDSVSKACGLLSFFPKVLRNFIDPETGKNLTPNDIIEMTNVEQLDVILSFYKAWIESMQIKDPIRPGDFSAITFYPSLIKMKMTWEFPQYVIDKNEEMFKSFERKTKKDYYDYMESVLNSVEEYKDTDDYLLGEFSGAFAEPETYLSKKPLDFYEDVVMGSEDPTLSQNVQKYDVEETEKYKQDPQKNG